MRYTLTTILLFIAATLCAGRLDLAKHYQNKPPHRHPYIQLLQRNPVASEKARSLNYEKLLVILVDFQEETPDDPNTTGNGKFKLEPDFSYLHSVGSPPHDRAYFLDNLEALRYYYLAASNGSYDLEYEVYPQTGAYTLPKTMGYYNPPDAGNELFVSRMEEYFKDSFELADSISPEIDFSAYGHFMIIHAGSDWQHDIFGDTPSDIPSFFISVGDGKEAVVDDGSVLISTACNVPSTISQDFYTETSDGQTVHGGYGALNAVIAHEFGHSLGLVDLYNVYNWQPMVGVFDIMDSGGSGVMVDVLNDGSYVLIEGALPALPGAWSRALLFEDDFLASGYLQEVEQIDLFENMQLAACSFRQDGQQTAPRVLRIPLSDSEYLLVENRNVDPDGDGGTAVYATDDNRVILYPTPLDDPLNTPSYEYDYLLPSFQAADGAAIGGGILVWHINDDVIFDQGVSDDEGNWYSNYENNSINTVYSQRGVGIIEADNLPDIGYLWSWYWTGTQYEYFHARKPVLDGNGYFVQWSQEAWKPALNGGTEPPLLDSQGLGSLYWLSDMGDPSASMGITIRSGFFVDTQIEDYATSGLLSGPPINSSYSTLDIPVLGDDSIRLLSWDGDQWTDLMGEFPWDRQPIDFPVVTSDQNGDEYHELAMVHDQALELVDFSSDNLHSMSINFPDGITSAPLPFAEKLFVSTNSCLGAVQDDTVGDLIQLPGILRLGSYGDSIVALCQDIFYLIDPEDLSISAALELPEPFGMYEPVSFTGLEDEVHMLFLMADSGNIYKYQDARLNQIFENISTINPTQMGLTDWFTYASNAINPVLFWACGSKVFAVKHDGTLLLGYPHDAYPLSFTPYEHVYAIQEHPQLYLYLPLTGKGHAAYSVADETINWNRSLAATGEIRGSHLFFNPGTDYYGDLFWHYADIDGDLFIHSTEVAVNGFGLHWNGFRNAGSGNYLSYRMHDEPGSAQEFYAFVFPNPVKGPQFRVRIGNFDQTMKLAIYDINAALLHNQTIEANGILRRDISIDSTKLSSGVYILSLECGDRHKRLKFAVEK